MRKLGDQTSLATRLLSIASSLDLTNLNAGDTAKAVYDLPNTEDGLGIPKEPDTNGARHNLHESHKDSA